MGTAGNRKRKREDQHETQESESSYQTYQTANGSFEMHTTEVGLSNTANWGSPGENSSHVTSKARQKQMVDVKTTFSVDKQDSRDDISAHAGAGPRELARAPELHPVNLIQEPSQILQNPGGTSFIDLTKDEEPHSPLGARLGAIKSAFEAITRGSDMNSSDSSCSLDRVMVVQEQDGPPREASDTQRHESSVLVLMSAEPESPLSLATSTFESQQYLDDSQDHGLLGPQLDGTSENQNGLLQHSGHSGNGSHAVSQNIADGEDVTKAAPSRVAPMRMYAIKEAYRAARRCLQDGADVGRWEDLSLRSVGRKGHTEEEIEL
jgi:hypothetical protein